MKSKDVIILCTESHVAILYRLLVFRACSQVLRAFLYPKTFKIFHKHFTQKSGIINSDVQNRPMKLPGTFQLLLFDSHVSLPSSATCPFECQLRPDVRDILAYSLQWPSRDS